MSDNQEIIGRKDIPFPFKESRGGEQTGTFASFDPEGRLIELYYVKKGITIGPHLKVDYGSQQGFATVCKMFPDPEARGSSGFSLQEFILDTVRAIGNASGHIDEMICGFCNRGQYEVRKLIAGRSSYICDECIEECSQVLAEELALDGDLTDPGEPHRGRKGGRRKNGKTS